MKKSILLLFCVFIFVGCSQKVLTPEYKENIKTIAVKMPLSKFDARKDIDVGGKSNIQNSTGMAGGFIGSLIGAAIDAGVKSNRKSNFNEKYSEEVKEINNIQVININESIKKRILKVLKENTFFSERLNNDSKNYFDTNIIAYGLVRFFEKDEKIYIGAALDATVSLINEEGEKVVEEFFPTKSSNSYTIEELLKNEKLIEDLYSQVYLDFENKFASFIDSSLDESKN
jgi:hypothetical protein